MDKNFGVLFAAFYSASISLSRLYLGRHHPTDVLFGIAHAIFVLYIWTQFLVFPFDTFTYNPSYLVPFSYLFGGIFLIWIHPRAPKINPTIAETALCIGACSGAGFWSWMNENVFLPYYHTVPENIFNLPIITGYTVIFLRLVLGAISVLFIKTVSKSFFRKFYTFLYQIGHSTSETKKWYLFEPSVKFSQFVSISGATYILAPVVFKIFGMTNPIDFIYEMR